MRGRIKLRKLSKAAIKGALATIGIILLNQAVQQAEANNFLGAGILGIIGGGLLIASYYGVEV